MNSCLILVFSLGQSSPYPFQLASFFAFIAPIPWIGVGPPRPNPSFRYLEAVPLHPHCPSYFLILTRPEPPAARYLLFYFTKRLPNQGRSRWAVLPCR